MNFGTLLQTRTTLMSSYNDDIETTISGVGGIIGVDFKITCPIAQVAIFKVSQKERIPRLRSSPFIPEQFTVEATQLYLRGRGEGKGRRGAKK